MVNRQQEPNTWNNSTVAIHDNNVEMEKLSPCNADSKPSSADMANTYTERESSTQALLDPGMTSKSGQNQVDSNESFHLYVGPQKYYSKDPSFQSVDQLYSDDCHQVPTAVSTFNWRDWRWEAGAALLSSSCVIATVAVLFAYQEKPFSSWNFAFGITLNTLIAILSALARAALLVPVASCISQLKWIHFVRNPRPLREMQTFEDASRGPWGSLELIWRLHFTTKLATWASIVTVLSLTMGPFAQQLLSYPTREVLSPNAAFSASQVYDTGAEKTRYTMSSQESSLYRQIDPKMQGAILNGLYNLRSPVSHSCPTGNCRWQDFTTLAVTSSCKNVTTSTRVNCTTSGMGSYELQCVYDTPSNFTFNSREIQSTSMGRQYTFYNSSVRGYSGDDENKLRSRPPQSEIISFAFAKMTPPFKMKRPEVTECDIRWCARVVKNAAVVNGTFIPGIHQDIALNMTRNPLDSGETSKQLNWHSFSVVDDRTPFPGNRTFSINPTDNLNIKRYLTQIFKTSDDDTSFSTVLLNASIPETVKLMTESITYALSQSRSGKQLVGNSITSEVYFLVRWPWITLPIAEVVMGIGLLICTILHSRRNNVIAWKSSAIVPLLTVMEDWNWKDLQAKSAREVEEQSNHMQGRFVTGIDGMQYLKRSVG